ncbi:hypothetical protein FSZ31_01645 [Sphingorhabdus soli]|uniref:Uncharacterized protein n=1 Tax=Flavisphingopyxis soli TaxID=2601267 RepID=A0A5C6ULQ5_9SPHN|nr:hypothetical protein [Sphingorhabdus soli]TXC73480.1 hypothetical protein FSZ31_01645 [Sphingorhabdus soli]
MKRATAVLALATLALSGCVSRGAAVAAPAVRPASPTPRLNVAGLENIIGATRSALIAALGQPRLDIVEGAARKLQFTGEACVFDAYLYPPRRGAEPVVTYVDARLPTGEDTDRARCAAALEVR